MTGSRKVFAASTGSRQRSSMFEVSASESEMHFLLAMQPTTRLSCASRGVNGSISRDILSKNDNGRTGGAGRKTKKASKTQQNALLTDDVAVDANSVGDRWTVQDLDRLADLIALIAMGQALHAAKIIEDLSPTSSAITAASLTEAAKRQLRISGATEQHKDASR